MYVKEVFDAKTLITPNKPCTKIVVVIIDLELLVLIYRWVTLWTFLTTKAQNRNLRSKYSITNNYLYIFSLFLEKVITKFGRNHATRKVWMGGVCQSFGSNPGRSTFWLVLPENWFCKNSWSNYVPRVYCGQHIVFYLVSFSSRFSLLASACLQIYCWGLFR